MMATFSPSRSFRLLSAFAKSCLVVSAKARSSFSSFCWAFGTLSRSWRPMVPISPVLSPDRGGYERAPIKSSE